MPVHDWTRVGAGTFHDFHCSWIVHLKESLNESLLPEGYYAQAEQHAGGIVADVLTLRTGSTGDVRPAPPGTVAVVQAPPKVALTMTPDETATYALARRTLTIRHSSDHRVVALIEVISTGNKDRRRSVQDFVDKAISAIGGGHHLLVIDLFPPGPFDPAGLHGAIWSEIGGNGYDPPSESPLTLASYSAGSLPRAYVEPIGVGTELPEMPLFLDPEFYVNVPLERDYTAAYRGVPDHWQGVIEAT